MSFSRNETVIGISETIARLSRRLGRAESEREMFRSALEVLGAALDSTVLWARFGDGLLEFEGNPGDQASAVAIPVTAANRTFGTLFVPQPHLAPGCDADLVATAAHFLAAELRRRKLQETLAEADHQARQELELSLILDRALEKLVDGMGFEFAAISLVDRDLERVSIVRSRNIAPGWRYRANYLLTEKDIQTWVVNEGKSFRNDGDWIDLFKEDTWKKYMHRNLSRLWCPIMAEGKAAGVIQVGCLRKKRDLLMTGDRRDAVEKYGFQLGPLIAPFPPRSRRLSLLASEAMIAAGADACLLMKVWHEDDLALIHINRGRLTEGLMNRVRELAGSGKLAAPDGVNTARGSRAYLKEIPVRGARCFFILEFGIGRYQNPEADPDANALIDKLEMALSAADVRDGLADDRDRAERMAALHALIGETATGTPIGDALVDIAQRALSMLDADTIGIYQHVPGASEPWLALLQQYGDIRHKDLISNSFPSWIADKIGDEGLFESNALDNRILGARREGDTVDRFVVREGIRSVAIVGMAHPSDSGVAGLVFVNYRTRREFSEREKAEIRSLAGSLGKLILANHYRLLAEARHMRRDRELNALRQFDESLQENLETVNLDAVCDRMAQTIVSITQAPVANILWEKCEGGDLFFRSVRGLARRQVETLNPWPRNRGLIGRAVVSGRHLVVPRTSAEMDTYVPFDRHRESELIVPIKEQGRVVGVINLEKDEEDAFTEDDARLLTLLAARLIYALHVAGLYRELNSQVGPRQTMGLIAVKIQEPARSLDGILRLVLTGITCGEGLGFSRAILFLADEEGAVLRGRVAIGAVSKTEAEENWSRAVSGVQGRNLKERLEWAIEQADDLTRGIEDRTRKDCELSRRCREWEIHAPFGGGAGAVEACFIEKRHFRVAAGKDDWLRHRNMLSGVDHVLHSFDCVPIVGAGRTLGVIVVDNCFVEDGNDYRLNDETLRTLEIFAELAALSVENRWLARIGLYRVAAHQIKAPIASAHRLLQHVDDGLSPKDLRIVASQVSRAYRIVSSSSLFGEMVQGRPIRIAATAQPVSVLRELVTTLVDEFAATPGPVQFRVRRESFDFPNCLVLFEEESLGHILGNILDNVNAYAFEETEAVVGCDISESGLRIYIRNQGHPLAPGTSEHATEMNWRGKGASNAYPGGQGLGLWVVAELLKAQGGHFSLEQRAETIEASVVLLLSGDTV